MKINYKSIEAKLSKVVTSRYIQIMSDAKTSGSDDKPTGWTQSEINKEVKQLKNIIFNAAKALTKEKELYTSAISGDNVGSEPTGLRWQGITPDDLLLHKITYIQRDKDNIKYITSCRIDLYFNPDVVRSPSLFNKNPGVDNLIRLLTNGWDFRNRAKKGNYVGIWYVGATKKGNPSDGNALHNVHARLYRRPNTKFIDAVAKYNSYRAGKKIRAVINSSYRGFDSVGNIWFN